MTIAVDTPGTLNVLLNLLQITAIIAAAGGFIFYARRQSTDKAKDDTITAYERENGILEKTVDRLEAELAESREEVQRMTGAFEQLREENRALRELVMGERVPTAMAEFMTGLATTAAEQISDAILRSEKNLLSAFHALGVDILERRQEGAPT